MPSTSLLKTYHDGPASMFGSSRIQLQCTVAVRHLAPRRDLSFRGRRRVISDRAGSPAPTEESTRPRLWFALSLGTRPAHMCRTGHRSRDGIPRAGIERVSQPPVRDTRFLGRRTNIQHTSGSRGRLPRNDSRALLCNYIHEEPYFSCIPILSRT